MSLQARTLVSESVGYFRVFATPPNGDRREITIFRGAPVQLDECGFGDPFSETTATMKLPQVTIFDNLGDGDLDWLVPDCDIDIVWQNTGKYEWDWRWEGYIASFDFSMDGNSASYNVSLRGALFGLDDYLAKPEFPRRPIPYELLISRAFDQEINPARLSPLKIVFPDGWDVRVPSSEDTRYQRYLRPWGVRTGQLWTGFTTRGTGSWEPVLTGFVQSLLSVMFAEGGSQWTIRNRGRRRPVLMLRERPTPDDPAIIEIVLGAPGVTFSGSKDFSQRADIIYGSGTDEAGISFNGMQVTPDGLKTYFKPFAHSSSAFPRLNNPFFNSAIKPKEVMMQFQNGVPEVEALKIAQAQLHRFSDPGIVGSITLTTDVMTAGGTPLSRLLIKAGDTVRVHGIGGVPEGYLMHVTTSRVTFSNLTTTLELDSKYRDELTVSEVKARTRDALTPLRMLQVGKYSNTIQDLVLPWSYQDGSGCLPRGSKSFFNELLPKTAEFPYEDWTTKYPPKDNKNFYVKIGPTATTNSTKNWAGLARDGEITMSIPIRMSQAGTIKLSQIAAYDKDGHVLPVKFHISVYLRNTVAADAMPKFAWDPDGDGTNPEIEYLKPKTTAGADITHNYGAFQENPFFKGAWERVDENGVLLEPSTYQVAENSGFVVGWGNYYEPAGYSPGRKTQGSPRTGLLTDTAPWSWDQTADWGLDQPGGLENPDEYQGILFVQIYCDDQGDEPVYFMGRFFRQEQGTN
jgi:hypothetical protein